MISLDQALVGVTRLALDTAPFIYFLERHPTYFPLARAIFARINSGAIEGYSSTVTIVEVLVLPKRHADRAIEQEYNEMLLDSDQITLVNLNAAIADTAADLRARHNLRTPDAIQIATALSANCEAFLTNDGRLRRVDELRVIVLDDLLPIPE